LLDHVSQNCRCYVIDPATEELTIPQEFVAIKKNAVAGMNALFKELTS